ncbi:MAG: hypothetical protein IJS61_10920 [Firmicutes bacterium]|nr:hypothetical protein [Bacillota bacterium]
MDGNKTKFVDFFLKAKQYFVQYSNNRTEEEVNKIFSSEDGIDSVEMGYSNALQRIANNEGDEASILDKEASDVAYCLCMLY